VDVAKSNRERRFCMGPHHNVTYMLAIRLPYLCNILAYALHTMPQCLFSFSIDRQLED